MEEDRIIVRFIDKLLTNLQANKCRGCISFGLAHSAVPTDSFSHLEVFTLQTQLSLRKADRMAQ